MIKLQLITHHISNCNLVSSFIVHHEGMQQQKCNV